MLRFTSSPTTKFSFQFSFLLALLVGLFGVGVGFRLDTLPFAPRSQLSDAAISRYPDALHFQRSLKQDHTLPLWNSHLMGGQPFAANPGTKVWYPLTWLLLIWNPAWHITLMTGFHLWLGAVGMWFWARQTGLNANAAALAAVGYLLAPKLMAHAGRGHLDLLMAMAWMPWLLYAIHRAVTEKMTPSKILGTAFAAAMIFISAIQLLPYLYGIALVYAVYPGWQRRGNNRLHFFPHFRAISLAGMFTLGFTAVQWMPLLELRNALSRGDMRESDAALLSLKPGQFVGLLIGDHGGSPEGITYVGISILVLAGLGLLLRPRQNRLWWGIVLLAGLYALGENFPLWTGLVRVFPPLLLFRVPSRAWLLGVLLLPYLAGWGLQFLLQNPPDSTRARLGVMGLFSLGITCAGANLVFLRDTEIETTALVGVFALPITALLIALAIFRKVPPRYLAWLFVLIAAADGLWIDRTLIEGRPREEWLREEPPPLIAHLADTGARIYTPDYAIPQQDTAYWGIARFDGVDPFQLGAFVRAAESAAGIPRTGYSTTVPAVVVLEDDEKSQQVKDAPMDAALLGQWGVEWVITGYEIDIDGLEFVAHEDELYFYENQFAWGDDVRLEWQNPNHVNQVVVGDVNDDIKTIANAPDWIEQTSSENHRPVDGNAVSLPPHEGEFSYHSDGVRWGGIISALTYAVALLWWGKTRER